VVTQKSVENVRNILSEDPNKNIQELANETGMSVGSVCTVLHKELELHKVAAKWIPHVLTEEHKKRRVEVSRQLLSILNEGFNNIITGDETWMHFFTVSSKNQNKVWIEKDENRPTIVRTARNSKKRMFCIFFSVNGVVAQIVVPEGQTVTGELYTNQILPSVFQKYKEIRGRTTVRDVMLHHDNAAPHRTSNVAAYLKQERVKLLPHPPYSPDLAPCDFFLFPKIKKMLAGKKYNKIEHLSRAVQAVVNSISQEEYYKSFESWQRRLQRCIDVEGDVF